MASLAPYAVTLGATDYPVKYAGLLSYIEPYLTNLETFSFSSGNVGLGCSPAFKFDLAVATNTVAQQWQGAGTGFALRLKTGNGATPSSSVYRLYLDYLNGTNTNGYIDFYRGPAGNDGYLVFGTAGADQAVLDGSGRFGLGTATNTLTNALTIYAAGSTARYAAFGNSNTGLNGTLFGVDASGNAVINQTQSLPLIFLTANTDRGRLDALGNLLIGTSSNSGFGGHVFLKNGTDANVLALLNSATTNPYGLAISFTASSPNDATRTFFSAGDSTTTRAAIRSNGGIANYSANNVNLSDRRLKKDIKPAGDFLAKVCAIPVQTFLYSDQTDDEPNLGVIAQDVQAVAPELVDTSGFGETPDGEEPYLTVYQTDLQYALMKAVQELAQKVATLEAA